MAARDFVVRWFGEKVTQKIEGFVNGMIFGEQSVTCPRCGRPVPAALVVERAACPVCQQEATDQTIIEALEVEKRAALAAGSDAINEAAGTRPPVSNVGEKGLIGSGPVISPAVGRWRQTGPSYQGGWGRLALGHAKKMRLTVLMGRYRINTCRGAIPVLA